ncbi:MAG: oligoendopeptidase F [Desulfobacteraceae bacterium]|nr:MAG: oligoendopeptidase F [Desulfobacteraceae bacterium]
MEKSAENVVWDLSDLYAGCHDPEIEKDRSWCIEQADRFGRDYRGRVARLSPEEILAALSLLEKVEEKCQRIASFAYLNFATQTQDPRASAFWQSAKELETMINRKILFFALEWSRKPDAEGEFLSNPLLFRYAHHLKKMRAFGPYRLSEPEEQILENLSLSGRHAWVNLFDKLMGQMRFGPEGLTIARVLADLYQPVQEKRRSAAMLITEGLEKILPLTCHIHNALSLDKSLRDDMRSFPHWLRNMNLRNELEDDQVNLLIRSVVSRYDIVQQYYSVKRKILGHSELHDYDRYAPLPGLPLKRFTWEEAAAKVLAALETFSPEAARIASIFFERNWIHAASISGKPGGAFSHPTVPSGHPYISMHFTGTYRDVMTLAHELGHGIHQFLCREQGLYGCQVPLIMAETASVFSEMVVFDTLLNEAESQEAGLAMLCSKLEDLFSTTFRQISLNRFEDALHQERRKGGEISPQRFSALWMNTQKEMFGKSVKLGEHYSLWWSYIPHFLHTPGYVYAYAFAELSALSLIHQYRHRGESFVPLYLDLLRKGATASPQELLRAVDIDISDPSFYQEGLDMLDYMVRDVLSRSGEGC